MRRYTVLLLTPDSLTSEYGLSSNAFHVDVESPVGCDTLGDHVRAAIALARAQALEMHDVDVNESADGADFHVIAVFAGHHDDLSPFE